MKHRNTGSISHKNTGYNNHTNTYGNHTDTYNKVYNQYQNHSQNYYDYGNYGDSGGGYGEYGAGRLLIEEILETKKIDIKVERGYGNYKQNIYSQSTYTQSGSKHTNTGYSNHTNTGYTNHINLNENVEPSVVGPVKDWTAAYYKDNINISWEKATDNNQCISVISASYGDGNAAEVGIYENTTKKVSIGRGMSIAYWNTSGVYQGGVNKDSYSSSTIFNEFKTYYNNIPNNCFVAMGSYDALVDEANMSSLKSWLVSLGISEANSLEGYRSAFACILKKGSGVLSQQVHRYGTTPTSAGSCSARYTITGASSQTITYTLEYAFKGVGQESYGSWTKITSTTALSYTYNLANHTNGFIKFRLIASDGVESSTTYQESKEIRILKYNKPTWTSNEKIKASDANAIDLELEKINTAIGVKNNPLNINVGDIIEKNNIISLRNKINNINRTLALGELADTNVDIIYKADLDNIKKNIDKI